MSNLNDFTPAEPQRYLIQFREEGQPVFIATTPGVQAGIGNPALEVEVTEAAFHTLRTTVHDEGLTVEAVLGLTDEPLDTMNETPDL